MCHNNFFSFQFRFISPLCDPFSFAPFLEAYKSARITISCNNKTVAFISEYPWASKAFRRSVELKVKSNRWYWHISCIPFFDERKCEKYVTILEKFCSSWHEECLSSRPVHELLAVSNWQVKRCCQWHCGSSARRAHTKCGSDIMLCAISVSFGFITPLTMTTDTAYAVLSSSYGRR